MADASPWAAIHEERRALYADLEDLTPDQWSTQSLCTAWSVHGVLGHMVATAKKTPPKFFASFAAAGFKFDTMTGKDVARETSGAPARTMDHFRDLLSATSHPPGPITAMVGEAVVHSEDIRRPLGITRKYPIAMVIEAADFYRGSNLIVGGRNRVAGLALHATDADWSAGSGPEVTGPMLSLLLAIAGRPVAIGDLSGDGLLTLTDRMAPR